MSKKRTKDPIHAGLFDIASALYRWADAQERIATSNEAIAKNHRAALALQGRDVEARMEVAAALKAETAAATAFDRFVDEPKPHEYVRTFSQDDRVPLFLTKEGRPYETGLTTARKTARILAFQASYPFVVETDRGPMTGAAGDWIVTNHPDDDAGSDLWTISDERFRATYEVVDHGDS